jgi:nucleoside-diphosphate-sugar epimerase
LQLNTIGAENLSQVSRSLKKRLIQISTVSVYGSQQDCNENSKLNPETNYALAKAFSEQMILRTCSNDKAVILRLCNLYGGNQKKGVFSYLIRSYLSDKKLNFNNNGELIRSFVHIEDCSRIIFEIVKNENMYGIYNIKGPETYYIKELIHGFEHRFNMVFEKSFGKELPWENINYLDNSKLLSKITYQPIWNIFDFFKQEIRSIRND